jgi:hypothetical protein
MGRADISAQGVGGVTLGRRLPLACRRVPQASPLGRWHCVVASPPAKGRAAGAQGPIPKLRPWNPEPDAEVPREDVYLVGPWALTRFDVYLWGHGSAPLTHFIVNPCHTMLMLPSHIP